MPHGYILDIACSYKKCYFTKNIQRIRKCQAFLCLRSSLLTFSVVRVSIQCKISALNRHCEDVRVRHTYAPYKFHWATFSMMAQGGKIAHGQHQAMIMPQTIKPSKPEKHLLHWFRKGLRLHDNPALLRALRQGVTTVRFVFILDPWFASSQHSINKWRFVGNFLRIGKFSCSAWTVICCEIHCNLLCYFALVQERFRI